MPSHAPSMNYWFLLKCLAAVSVFAILLTYLLTPTTIVVAATMGLAAATAATATTSLFFPVLPLLAAGLFLAVLISLPVFSSTQSYLSGPSYAWNPFAPAFWLGTSYLGYSWWGAGARPSVFSNHNHSHNTHTHGAISPQQHGHHPINSQNHGHSAPVSSHGMFNNHSNHSSHSYHHTPTHSFSPSFGGHGGSHGH